MYLKEEMSDLEELMRGNMAQIWEQSRVHVCVLQAEEVGSASGDSGAWLLALFSQTRLLVDSRFGDY